MASRKPYIVYPFIAGFAIMTTWLAVRFSAPDKRNNIPSPRVLDSATIVNDLRFLSSDSCEGRAPGSAGHDLAVQRIVARMREAGLDSFNGKLVSRFTGKNVNETRDGKNIIGWVKGTQNPERYIVISAHYDHVGIINDEIYYGASDNASGTACILGLADYFKKHPLPYSLIFAAFDREETGLEGARHFIQNLPAPLSRSSIRMNLNLDMITRNDKNELFFCGISHYPSLQYLVDKIKDKTTIRIRTGHDSGKGRHDWTSLSDHYVFHQKKIPFLYLGTEDHPDYHRPTDTFDKTDLASYIETCNMIVLLAQAIRL